MNRAMATAAILIAAVLAALPRPGQAVDCAQVDFTVSPCLAYLQIGGDAPPQPCCDAVNALIRITPSQQDRQDACECLKAAAPTFGIKAEVAAGLPAKCGVSTGVPISPDINCQRDLLRQTPTEQRTACECYKATAASPDIKPDIAYYFPRNCGLASRFTISRDSDSSFEVEDYTGRTVYSDSIEGKLWIAAA
nr:non-specific lipid-transfer protein A-like [Ipomoea trifida]